MEYSASGIIFETHLKKKKYKEIQEEKRARVFSLLYLPFLNDKMSKINIYICFVDCVLQAYLR